MAPFLSHRQWTIAALVVLLMLLAGLPSPLNPARAQSEPTINLNPTEGAPGTQVAIQGSGWVPGETVILWFAVNLEADGSSTENTSWYDIGQATVADDGTFVSTFTVPAEATDTGAQGVGVDTYEASKQAVAFFHVVTEPEETPPPEDEPSLNPQVTALQFYESGYENLPLEQRVYTQRFASDTSRYIRWELDLEYPAPGRRIEFGITAIWYQDNGTGSWEEMHRHTLDTYVEGDWTGSYHEWGYGCDEPEGCWDVGSYRVDIYFEGLGSDGQLMASEQFEIYGEAETNLVANAGPDQTAPGPSPVAVQFDGSESTGDIVRYQWYNQWGLLLAEGATPVIEVNFGHEDPQPGTQRRFTLVVEDSQGNTAQDEVTITLGETPQEENPPCPEPTVTVSASSGRLGEEFTVQGEGWAPGGFVSFFLSSPETNPSEFAVGGATIPDSGGWKYDSFALYGQAGLQPGDYELSFIEWDAPVEYEECELRVTKPFTIIKPSITLDPIEGAPGTKVTVRSSGWLPNATVKIHFAEPGNEVAQVKAGEINLVGSFETTFTVPANAVIGEQKVIAVSADGAWQTDTNFLVTTPPITSPRRQLIIFLPGILTSLSSEEANQGEIVRMGTLSDTVREVFPEASLETDASTRLLMYSYKGSNKDNGLPNTYDCDDTVTYSIVTYAQLLDMQIRNAFKEQPEGAEVDVYLIGHSLGGAVAIAYVDFLQQELGMALPANANLKAVITLDSPLGGHRGFNQTIEDWIRDARCPELGDDDPRTSVRDLEEVFDSIDETLTEADETAPRGARASFLTLHRGEPNWEIFTPSNGDLTEAAQIERGTSFLSIGNIRDLFLTHCGFNPGDAATQFLEDEGDGKGLYGREFARGAVVCGILPDVIAERIDRNHSMALTLQIVQDAIKEFLNPIADGAVGGTPDPLRINRYQTNSP